MCANFGSLTMPKVNFNVDPSNKRGLTLSTDYNKQWNIFDEAKKRYEAAQGNGGEPKPNVDISSLEYEMAEALEKLEKLQAILAQEVGGNKPEKNNTSTPPDKDEKNKVKGKSLPGMMA